MLTANRARGESNLKINGNPYVLCLTLGALAQLETAFEVRSLEALVARLKTLSGDDILILLSILIQNGKPALSLEALRGARLNIREAMEAIAKTFESAL